MRTTNDSANGTKMSTLGRWHLDQTRTLVAVTPRASRAAVLVALVALVVGVLAAWAVMS